MQSCPTNALDTYPFIVHVKFGKIKYYVLGLHISNVFPIPSGTIQTKLILEFMT